MVWAQLDEMIIKMDKPTQYGLERDVVSAFSISLLVYRYFCCILFRNVALHEKIKYIRINRTSLFPSFRAFRFSIDA